LVGYVNDILATICQVTESSLDKSTGKHDFEGIQEAVFDLDLDNPNELAMVLRGQLGKTEKVYKVRTIIWSGLDISSIALWRRNLNEIVVRFPIELSVEVLAYWLVSCVVMRSYRDSTLKRFVHFHST
jgi:hypothetical protein